jgi:hypothetical protein
MDPITAAIVAAVSAGAIGGLTEASKTALTDAYGKLKALLIKKFGKESDVIQAVEQVEAKPKSAARKATLAEEVTEVKANQDNELLELAEPIRQLLQEQAKTNATIQQIISGSYNAISVYGDANMTLQAPKDV